MFGIAFVYRITYNIWFLVSHETGEAYIISSFFMFLISVALPLLVVFRQHLRDVPKQITTPNETESSRTNIIDARQQYVDRLSAIEQTEEDDELRRVTELRSDEIQKYQGIENLDKFRGESLLEEEDSEASIQEDKED